MLTDARKFPRGHRLETDICLIGAGAAGITLARELAGSSSRVLLLESGGFELDGQTQSLYDGEIIGRPYAYHRLDSSRLRYFGGSTNHFGGACRVLDPIDFEGSAGLPGSGWPFTYQHMDPFYKRAQVVFQVSPIGFATDAWVRGTGYPRMDVGSKQMETRIWQMNPLRFGTVYRKELVNSPKVTVCLHATAVGFDTDGSKNRVSTLRCGVLGGPEFTVASRVYVLCCGGIENARLLLVARDDGALTFDRGDALGRFFMEHLIVLKAAEFVPMAGSATPANLYSSSGLNGYWFSGALAVPMALARAERLQNVVLHFDRAGLPPTGRAALGEIWDAVRDARLPDEPGDALSRVFSGMDDRIDQTVRQVFGTRSGIFNKLRAFEPCSVQVYAEQAPNRDSRVSLGDARDSMGQRKARFHWQLSRSDKRSVLRTLEIIGAELARLGIGRLRVTLSEDLDGWPEDLVTHCHHMGTTRMDSDARRGVVDENCRVHGVDNLYVAGSSIFPTVGSAPPTLTIVALALRLADHLKQRKA